MSTVNLSIECMDSGKLEAMVTKISNLITKGVVPEYPLDTLNITIATDFPVSSEVQRVADLLRVHSTPDTIISVVEA